MPRVIGGEAKGRRLKAPRGGSTRPTGARVRQSLFDMLGGSLRGMRLLDLCAGTGAVGIEALSRGAEAVVFVENDPRAATVLRTNLKMLSVPSSRCRVVQGDCVATLRALGRARQRFDVVFFDPPYESDLYERVLDQAGRQGILAAPGSVLVAEHFHKRALPERIGPLACVRSSRIGDHSLSLYCRAAEE